MPTILSVEPLTKNGFSPFGEVIEKDGAESFLINNGKCRRHHALALSDIEKVEDDGKVGISIFSGEPYALPLQLNMVERHPLGSQAFYPLGNSDWLVIVCSNENEIPAHPRVFIANANQGVNLNRGQWHGVLTPLYEPSDFLVVDRIGDAHNLEEHFFDSPYLIEKI